MKQHQYTRIMALLKEILSHLKSIPPTVKPYSPWLTIEEFCSYWNLKSRIHVMFLARSGKIPGARKVNRKWLFHREKMERWNQA